MTGRECAGTTVIIDSASDSKTTVDAREDAVLGAALQALRALVAPRACRAKPNHPFALGRVAEPPEQSPT